MLELRLTKTFGAKNRDNQDKSRHFIRQTALTSNLDFDSLQATKN